MSWLQISDDGPIRRLTMQRPERLNAVPPGGWSDLAEAFEAFEASDQRVLIVSGAGGAFCSGADVGDTPSGAPSTSPAGGTIGVADGHRRMAKVGEAASALRRITKPTVAAVDGVAVGAGMNLALGCDLVIASHRARFSEIFVKRGLSVDFGGSWILPRLVGLQRAKELALTGRMVHAEEAVRIGLCLEIVEAGDLDRRVHEIATALADGAPVPQMFIKQVFDRSFELSFEDALSWEGQNQAICFTTEDFAEGRSAFTEGRPPHFRGR